MDPNQQALLDAIQAYTQRILSNRPADSFNNTDSLSALRLVHSLPFGRKLYSDEEFVMGTNGISVYDLLDTGSVTLTRVIGQSGVPNSTGNILRVVYDGLQQPAPNNGGFRFATVSRPNARYITRFLAKLPVGRAFAFTTNDIGSDNASGWLTSNEGTGKWTYYVYEVVNGSVGVFEDTNYFSVLGTGAYTLEIASATVIDVTDQDTLAYRRFVGDLVGNASTVTDGMYLSQTQVVTGLKQFDRAYVNDFTQLGQRIISLQAVSPPNGSGAGRWFVRLHQTNQGPGTYGGTITVGGGWNNSPIAGVLSREFAFHIAEGGTSFAFLSSRISAATGPAYDNLRIGLPQVVDGWVGFYVWSFNANAPFIRLDLMNYPLTYTPSIQPWEANALPAKTPVTFNGGIIVGGEIRSTTSSSTGEIDVSQAAVWTITDPGGTRTITINNLVNTQSVTVVLRLISSRATIWPGTINWADGLAPVLGPNWTIVVLTTFEGTIYGSVGPSN